MTSTLALVVALGGGAYAAAIADNSVGARHLKDDAVTNVKVANGAVGTAELKKNAVVAAKIKPQSVTAAKLSGDAKKIHGYERVYSGNITLPQNSVDVGYGNGFRPVTVSCPSGKVAIGGGHWSNITDIQISWSYAIDSQTWQVMAWNPSNETNREIGAHVICANG